MVVQYWAAGTGSQPLTPSVGFAGKGSAGPPLLLLSKYDFGSILAFTERNFGLNFIDQGGDHGYADYNAPDWGPQQRNVPLSDIFGSTYHNFTSINTSEPYTCFQNFAQCTGTDFTPAGPDSDDGD